MTDHICDHCDMPRAYCAHSPAARAAEAENPFLGKDAPRRLATFRSECPSCGEDIEVDDPIVLMEKGQWVHERHNPPAEAPPSDSVSQFGGFEF